MAFFLLLVVLAITYNQGVARPADSDLDDVTSNGWDYSEESQNHSDGGKVFNFPTSIRKGLFITIKGTLNMNDQTFTMVLPSKSSNKNCEMVFDFEDKSINITPSAENPSTEYDANFVTDSKELPKFILHLKARLFSTEEQAAFTMIFNGNNAGDSEQLTCLIKNFQDIDSIIIKEGAAHVDSLMFEFDEDH